MVRVHYVHTNAAEAEARVGELRRCDFEVTYTGPDGQATLRAIRASQPAAVVIDLSRLPSHGRALAVAMRQSKTTRSIPIVFVGGAPEKVELTRKTLPDADFVEWDVAGPAIRIAAQKRLAMPVVPPPLMGYTASPLPQKLGMKPNQTVAILGAPDGFESYLESVPGLNLRTDLRRKADVILAFAKSIDEMEVRLRNGLKALAAGAKLWIVYPKKASGIQTDLTEAGVREFGLALGLVDYKVCAVDQTWTGLCFARRREKTARA
jgi:hypothetical protein